MKKIFLAACFAITCLLAAAQVDTLLNIGFNSADGLKVKEETSGQFFSVSTIKKQAEIVPAFFNKGLRTDGYSTALSVPLPQELKDTFSIAGWFALETYPTDTAGFFAVKNNSGTRSVSACINQFGFPVISINSNGVTKYFSSEIIIPKFKWLHTALVIAGEQVQMFVDGKKMINALLDLPLKKNSFDSLLIGKTAVEKSIAIFPVNYINGIIDEVCVINSTLNESDFQKNNYAAIGNIKPGLNIPASRFAEDFNRPQYHLLPAANWTNETHGLIYYKGRYHIFNQKDGANLILRQINWGHFSSPDLLHWTEHPPAITPEKGYDQLGIWSGHCIIGPDGKPAIIYTGASSDTSFGLCLAFPQDDSLITWKKYEGNPVVKGTPKQYKRFDFRDPYLWKEHNQYYMAVGFGIDENQSRHGALLLYKSADLKNWQYLHPLYEGNPAVDGSGVFWEMPVFWKQDGKYILLVNKVPDKREPANALYWVGDFVNEKFVPDNKMPRTLEVINQLLSPSVTKDKNGWTMAIAIIPDLISAKAQYEQGWTHLYSMPRTWVLKGDKICQQPHPVMQTLRDDKKEFTSQEIAPAQPLLLSNGTQQAEIEIEIDPLNCEAVGFIIGKNPAGNELTKITYDFSTKEFSVDKSMSSLNKNIYPNGRKGKYLLNHNEKVNIHLFIDGSVVEVFINNEDAFTTRIFPLLKDSTQVELFSKGAPVKLLKATVWKLKAAGNKTDF